MTLPEAHDTARRGAERFGNTWRVFRLASWPSAVYTASAKEPPSEAHIVATYTRYVDGRPHVTTDTPAAAPPVESQGSLF